MFTINSILKLKSNFFHSPSHVRLTRQLKRHWNWYNLQSRDSRKKSFWAREKSFLSLSYTRVSSTFIFISLTLSNFKLRVSLRKSAICSLNVNKTMCCLLESFERIVKWESKAFQQFTLSHESWWSQCRVRRRQTKAWTREKIIKFITKLVTSWFVFKEIQEFFKFGRIGHLFLINSVQWSLEQPVLM